MKKAFDLLCLLEIRFPCERGHHSLTVRKERDNEGVERELLILSVQDRGYYQDLFLTADDFEKSAEQLVEEVTDILKKIPVK